MGVRPGRGQDHIIDCAAVYGAYGSGTGPHGSLRQTHISSGTPRRRHAPLGGEPFHPLTTVSHPVACRPITPRVVSHPPGEWTFPDFLKRGLIEYLDVNEENVSLIALYEKDCNK